ncbi:hypothetical protein PDESU_04013 [Pontiella desulfatans]|uniref:Uncharacterized protein n=1 Tax=Pontiella desulfatans TaxID=2750659 RepID=A0A6C2U5Z1_PONDE|nr:thrombospondin type 3 repeat-containing protein [Pontiella desulfatans]VGO15430.1 hypothetical protein PDESU_04013 [Pontiella desulfatans]
MFRIAGTAIPADSDGDGLTDALEIALGTNPDDPDSMFAISDASPVPTSGTFRLAWPSATGVLYRVWESPGLAHWSVTQDWLGATAIPTDFV